MGTTKTFQNSTIVAGKVDTTASATGYNTTTARTNTLTTVGIGTGTGTKTDWYGMLKIGRWTRPGIGPDDYCFSFYSIKGNTVHCSCRLI